MFIVYKYTIIYLQIFLCMTLNPCQKKTFSLQYLPLEQGQGVGKKVKTKVHFHWFKKIGAKFKLYAKKKKIPNLHKIYRQSKGENVPITLRTSSLSRYIARYISRYIAL